MTHPNPTTQQVIKGLTLDGLRGFEAAARLGSFTAAAEALCLSQSAISKQIKAMEALLGKPLFMRGGRGLALTDEGRVLHEGVIQALQHLASAIDAVVQAPRSSVAITVPPAFASLWLAPRLAAYRAIAPGVDIRLDASEARVNLSRAGMDLAVRLASVDDAASDWTLLLRERLVLLASPEVASHIRAPADLRHLPLLAFDHKTARAPGMNWAHWFDMLGLQADPRQAVHRFTQYEHLLKAAKDGLGLAIGRLPLVADLIADGQLQTVLPACEVAGLGYFLVFSNQVNGQQAHARQLGAWLQAAMR